MKKWLRVRYLEILMRVEIRLKMKNCISSIAIFFFLFLSCKEKEKKQAIEINEITNEFRLIFLNEILSDSTNLKYYFTKNGLISNMTLLPPPSFYPYDVEKESHYISEILNINDTAFVSRQFKLNSNFSFDNLSKYGYKILDVKSIVKNKNPYNQIQDSVKKHYNGKNEFGCLTTFSKPIFNKEKNKAYVRVGCGSSGCTLIFIKNENKWKIEKEFNQWVK